MGISKDNNADQRLGSYSEHVVQGYDAGRRISEVAPTATSGKIALCYTDAKRYLRGRIVRRILLQRCTCEIVYSCFRGSACAR